MKSKRPNFYLFVLFVDWQGGCGSGLLQRELRMAIGDKRYSVLDRRALEQAVAVDPTLHLCASPDCPFVTSWSGPEDGAPVMDCLVCHHRRCMVCGADPYHDGTGCPVPAEEEEDASMQFIANSNIRLLQCTGLINNT